MAGGTARPAASTLASTMGPSVLLASVLFAGIVLLYAVVGPRSITEEAFADEAERQGERRHPRGGRAWVTACPRPDGSPSIAC